MRRSALALLLAACTARPPPATGCSDAGCAGCCDTQGQCQAGNVRASCGSGGAGCTVCSASQRCGAGACADEPTGCAATCTGCCDDGGACRAGRAPLECGEGGAACTACARGRQCSAGACITVSQCDVACGAACCSGSACAAMPCGVDGGACATCGAGELCTAGACGGAAATRWKLKVVSATLAAARSNGMPWDDKNDPDAKVCANVGDAGQVCTLEASETFTPVWNMTFPGPYAFEQLGSVELSVIDSDFPGQTVIDELGTLDLRPRWSGAPQVWTVSGASVTALRLEVEPAP